MDGSINGDEAVNILVELEQRLHLVHRQMIAYRVTTTTTMTLMERVVVHPLPVRGFTQEMELKPHILVPGQHERISGSLHQKRSMQQKMAPIKSILPTLDQLEHGKISSYKVKLRK